jgi:hypothetical protein
MKAKARGQPEETLCYEGMELRHEPAGHLLVLHRNGTDIATFNEADVARWYMEDA